LIPLAYHQNIIFFDDRIHKQKTVPKAFIYMRESLKTKETLHRNFNQKVGMSNFLCPI